MSESMFLFDTKVRVKPTAGLTKSDDNSASLFLRYIAFWFDTLLMLSLLIFVEIFISAVILQLPMRTSLRNIVAGHLIFWGIPAQLLTFIVHCYFYLHHSASPGKLALNLKVVKKDKSRNINIVDVFLREIVGKFYSVLVFGFGFIYAFLRKDGRALHDLIAGTQVVSADQKSRLNR